MKRIFTVFGILCFTLGLTAQEIVLKGTVIDAQDESPLAYAHINIVGQGKGTLSNAAGQFSLKLEQIHLKDSVLISYLGYDAKVLSVESLVGNTTSIRLDPSVLDLTEVVVKPMDGQKMIEEAIQKVPQNFANQPHIKEGFYRLISEDEGTYLHLSEAVFDVFLSEYSAKSKDYLKLIKARSVKDEKGAMGLDLGLKPYLIFEYDMVSDIAHSDILSKRGLKNHSFEWKGITRIQDHEVHEIWFDQKDGVRKGLYKGKIYLTVDELAFVHISYGLSPKGKQWVKFGDSETRVLLRLAGLKIDLEQEEFQVWYQKVGERWYLSHVHNDVVLSVKNTRSNEGFRPHIKVDYLVTSLQLEAVKPFSSNEAIGNGRLIQYHERPLEPDFWKDYNILLPDQNFVELAKAIQARNAANEED
jgi:hypothetical protein